jgi:hypothetical protein
MSNEQELVSKFFSLMLSNPETRIALANVVEQVGRSPERIAQLAEWLRGDATLPIVTVDETQMLGSLMGALQRELDTPEFTRLAMRTVKGLFF